MRSARGSAASSAVLDRRCPTSSRDTRSGQSSPSSSTVCKPANVVIGSLVAGVWKVFGYFIAGGILSGFGPALGEIIGNSFQMVVGLIVGFALFSAVRKAYPPLVRLGNLSVKAGE